MRHSIFNRSGLCFRYSVGRDDVTIWDQIAIGIQALRCKSLSEQSLFKVFVNVCTGTVREATEAALVGLGCGGGWEKFKIVYLLFH